MPLTPEDVVEKRFNPTRVREGYAQDEVDDFLDEVVAELRRLHAEGEELRAALAQSRARVAELSRVEDGADAAAAVPAPAPPADDAARLPQVEAPAPAPAPAAPSDAAAGVLALAQRLHDEHVRDGEQQRDALVAGAERRRDELVSAAEEHAQRLVADAEERREQTLGDLQSRRRELDDAIGGLQGRESAYREQLESFIAAQLEDLRRTPRVVPQETRTS